MRSLKNTLTALLNNHTQRHASAQRRKYTQNRLRIESLEQRLLMTAVPVPQGLVSWWSANSSGADVMGQNNATLVNGTAFAAAEVGKGFSFDGVNDWASLGDPSSLAFTSSFSIEGWIKVNALNPNANFESNGPAVVEGASGTTTPATFTIRRTGNLAGSLMTRQLLGRTMAPLPDR
jgi:hypothetical protein